MLCWWIFCEQPTECSKQIFYFPVLHLFKRNNCTKSTFCSRPSTLRIRALLFYLCFWEQSLSQTHRKQRVWHCSDSRVTHRESSLCTFLIRKSTPVHQSWRGVHVCVCKIEGKKHALPLGVIFSHTHKVTLELHVSRVYKPSRKHIQTFS